MKHVFIVCFLFVRTTAVVVDAKLIESVFIEATSVILDKALEYAEESRERREKILYLFMSK